MKTKDWIVGLLIILVVTFYFLQKSDTRSRKKGNRPARPVVVVYVSEKRSIAKPILEDFEKETNITVRAHYGTDKNFFERLLKKKTDRRADVYWSADPIAAAFLKTKKVLAPYRSPSARTIPSRFKDPDGYWTGFAARARLFAVNAKATQIPRSVEDYTRNTFRSKAVFTHPLFRPCGAYLAALFLVWGDDRAEAFLKTLTRNDIAMTDNDALSTELVAQGRYDFALVGSDELIGRMRKGANIVPVYPDQGQKEIGCFILPDTVTLLRGAPHQKSAKKLIGYLLSRKTEAKLASLYATRIPLHQNVQPPEGLKKLSEIKTLAIDYNALIEKLTEIRPLLIRLFASMR